MPPPASVSSAFLNALSSLYFASFAASSSEESVRSFTICASPTAASAWPR